MLEAPTIKSPEELEIMRVAGGIVGKCLKLVGEMVAPGITTIELDKAVEDLIRKEGAIPAFLNYPSPSSGVPPYPASICASVDEEVVHGIPGDRVLVEGEIISVDIGAQYNGFFGDAARTFPVGDISKKASKLLTVTEQCLRKAEAAMKPGCKLTRVSSIIQDCAQGEGYSVVKQFVGHGIGKAMHEAPQVQNYVTPGMHNERLRLEAGMVLCPEPMVNVGRSDVVVKQDGWTVITKDRTLSAHFEDTIAITENGTVNFTNYQ